MHPPEPGRPHYSQSRGADLWAQRTVGQPAISLTGCKDRISLTLMNRINWP